ncbi:MAG: hypothetical protein EOO17_06125 [Chloroflexi bacterium]|nr:MAG: hypothetical protein EOO17_06125 [Chloroflexota bacterium]
MFTTVHGVLSEVICRERSKPGTDSYGNSIEYGDTPSVDKELVICTLEAIDSQLSKWVKWQPRIDRQRAIRVLIDYLNTRFPDPSASGPEFTTEQRATVVILSLLRREHLLAATQPQFVP